MELSLSELASRSLLGTAAAFAPIGCISRQIHTAARRIHIEALGTSITRGPYKRSRSYPAMLERFLRTEYPAANITVRNRGFNGFSLDLLVACVHRTVSSQASIVMIETTDNLGFTTSEQAVALLTRLVRTLRERRQPRPEIILVSPFAQRCARRLLRIKQFAHTYNESASTSLASCFDATALPTAMENLAADLGVPCVSMRAGLREVLAASPRATIKRYLQDDAIHPSFEGYELLARGCLQAFKKAAGAECRDDRIAPIRPPSLRPSPPATCAFGEEMQRLVLKTVGWKYTIEHSRQGHAKPGYVATAPGATLDVCHPDGPAATVWQFAFLKSYEGMGQVRGECVKESGCSCKPRTWDGHTPRRVSQSTMSKLKSIVHHRRLHSGSGCQCVVRLTVLSDTSSAGHKFKVDALFGSFRIYDGSALLQGVRNAAAAPS